MHVIHVCVLYMIYRKSGIKKFCSLNFRDGKIRRKTTKIFNNDSITRAGKTPSPCLLMLEAEARLKPVQY